VWLLGFGALVLVPLLALLAYAIYTAVAKPPAYMFPLALALAGAVCVWLCGDLVWTVWRKLPRTPAELRVPLVLSQVSLLAWISVTLFLVLGLDRDWANGPARFLLTGTGSVFLVAWMAFKRILDRRPNEIPD
jgi:hypothetical protein